MVDLVVFGAGGLAREVLNAILDANDVGHGFHFRGFVADPEPDLSLLDRLQARWLGKPGDPELMTALAGVSFVVGIGDIAVRRRVHDEAIGWGLVPTTVVHPLAVVGRDVDLQPGVMILPGAVITSNIGVGEGTLINPGCTISHDTTVGAFCSLAPNASLSGRCWLGDGVDVGAGATVLPDRRIGNGARIGAGVVVTKDVGDGVTVVGVPARPLPGGA